MGLCESSRRRTSRGSRAGSGSLTISFAMRSSGQNEALSMPISVAALFSSAWPGRDEGAAVAIERSSFGGFRQRCIFVHGFAKSGKSDLTPGELEVYRKFAELLLRYDDEALEAGHCRKGTRGGGVRCLKQSTAAMPSGPCM